MKILQVIDTSTYGGAENHTRLITKAFARAGHKTILVNTPGEYFSKFCALRDEGIKVIPLNVRHSFFKAIIGLRRIIKNEGIELVHAHQYRTDFLVRIALIGLPHVKFMSTIHYFFKRDIVNPLKRWVYAQCLVFTYRRIDLIVTVSDAARDETRDYFHLGEKVQTVLNGIDLHDVNYQETRTMALRDKHHLAHKTVLLCVGVLTPRKGQRVLVEALELLKEAYPNLVLLLVGEGPEYTNLTSVVKLAGISDRLIIIPRSDNIWDYLSLADIYLQPSLKDPLPRALLEAMGIGLPCIASHVDGIPEVIIQEKTGLMVDAITGENFADSIRLYLTNPRLKEQCGSGAKVFIANNCTTDIMVDKIIKQLGFMTPKNK